MARFIGVFAILSAAAPLASAATVDFRTEITRVPRSAVLDGAPGNNLMFRFYATTSADIVSINQVRVTLAPSDELYQVSPPWGSNVDPPPPAFIALLPRLAADSWVTTPGVTQMLGADLPGDGGTLFGDFTNDGPQTDFLFAQLTSPVGPGYGPSFSGRLTVAGANGPEDFPFAFVTYLEFDPNEYFPEPSALALAGIAITTLAAGRERQQPGRY